MVEQRWLRTANERNDGNHLVGNRHLGSVAAGYPPCVIDEVTESFFAAPLLSIDETVLRAFPVDPFDVARTRRRATLSLGQATALIDSETELSALASLANEVAPATYAAIEPSDVTPPVARVAAIAPVASVTSASAPLSYASYAAPVAFVQAAPAAAVQATHAAPSFSLDPAPSAVARGWLAGGLLALAGVFVGGALVCAALTRTEARVEPMPSAMSALQR